MNGCIIGECSLKPGESIVVDATAPIPKPDETIVIQVNGRQDTARDIIEIVNKIPPNAISPEKAFRKALEVFYRAYGEYPGEEYTFHVEYRDNQYWLVIIDDHDGIGGLVMLRWMPLQARLAI